jgi:hypothetical protein
MEPRFTEEMILPKEEVDNLVEERSRLYRDIYAMQQRLSVISRLLLNSGEARSRKQERTSPTA